MAIFIWQRRSCSTVSEETTCEVSRGGDKLEVWRSASASIAFHEWFVACKDSETCRPKGHSRPSPHHRIVPRSRELRLVERDQNKELGT